MAIRKHRWVVFAGVGALTLSGFASAESARPAHALAATGKPLVQARADLDACLARKCAPPQDIAATIELADALLAAGEWTEAAKALAAGRDRNRGYANAHPVEVAALVRTAGDVAWLRGKTDAYRMAMIDTVDALKAGLGDSDPRVMLARIEVADGMARGGMPFNSADNKYREAIADARARGMPAAEGMAMFRLAAMYAWGAELDRGAYEKRAREAIGALTSSSKPEHAAYARAARVLEGQLGTYFGTAGASEGLIAALRAQPKPAFELLSYEPIEVTAEMKRGGPHKPGQAIDFAYWVTPDGRVRGHIVLLQYDHYAGPTWGKAIATSIASRRYAPLGLDTADPGVMRIERYTISGGGGAPARIEMRALTGPDTATVEVPTKPAKPSK